MRKVPCCLRLAKACCTSFARVTNDPWEGANRSSVDNCHYPPRESIPRMLLVFALLTFALVVGLELSDGNTSIVCS